MSATGFVGDNMVGWIAMALITNNIFNMVAIFSLNKYSTYVLITT